jgi:hypothetical protein
MLFAVVPLAANGGERFSVLPSGTMLVRRAPRKTCARDFRRQCARDCGAGAGADAHHARAETQDGEERAFST